MSTAAPLRSRTKLPGNARPRPSMAPVLMPQTIAPDIRIGDFVVGPNGITCGDPSWVPPTVKLEDLDKVGRLGSGKQGDVYKYCRKDNPNVKYALKIIKLTAGLDLDKNKDIVAELKSALGHTVLNTVTLENAYVKDGKLVLIMEYMNYGNLRELIDQVKSADGCPAGLPEPVVAWIASQVTKALFDMNAGAGSASLEPSTEEGGNDRRRAHIHRDIKPENILLTREGVVKLADFGVATSADSIGASTFVGTVSYMSPERIKGNRHGPASDVWSLGVVAAEALLGRFPYPAAEAGIFQLMKEIATTHITLPPTICGAESQAFIDNCLIQESEKRLSAAALLESPWIRMGLAQQDSLRQLIRRCIAKSRPPPPPVTNAFPPATAEATPTPSQQQKV